MDGELKPVAVLAVEDNAADVTLMRHALRRVAFPVDLKVAVNGELALKMLSDQDYRPDLIIIDLNLPRIDGYTLLTRIAPSNIPTVVFSSTSDPQEISRALALGARQFVNKPGDLESFMSAVSGMVLRWADPHEGGAASATVS